MTTSASSIVHPPARKPSRAFATVLTIWVLGLLAILLVVIQTASFKQAGGGRERLARVRAYWSARAGVEMQVARLTDKTLNPDPTNSYAVTSELASVATGELATGSWDIRHFDGIQMVAGPLDAHAHLNVNTLTVDDFLLLDSMDEGVAESIISWTTVVDPTAVDLTTGSGLGADVGAYTGLRYPYEPRQGPARSLRELELVQFVDPILLRGEDGNYNNRLDASEDDGSASPPDDNVDGGLNQGWAQYLTAVSEGNEGLAASGQLRLDLRTATAEEIASRLKIEQAQAQAISNHAANNTMSVRMLDYVGTTLATMAQASQATSGGATILTPNVQTPQELTDDQLKTLLDECTVKEDLRLGPRQGRANLNTARRETLERLASIELDELDSILLQRDSQAGGFTSMVDLLKVEGMSRTRLAELMPMLDVRSSTYIVTSRGKDKATGIEVEIVAVLDRSSIPVVIKDLFVR